MQKIRSALYVCPHRLKGAEGSKGSRVSHLSRIPHISKLRGAFDFYAPHPYSSLLTRKKSFHWRSKRDTPQGLTPNSLATSLCVRYNRIKVSSDCPPVTAMICGITILKEYQPMYEETTIAAIATSPGEGGIGDRKSTRLNSSHRTRSRMPSSA